MRNWARIAVLVLMISLCASAAMAALAQGYPSKPIRVVTYEPGGGGDFVARVIAQGLTSSLRQQVIVDNRGSASGMFAAQTVAKALPDGYTLLLYGSAVWLLPFMRDSVTYDPVKDFAPITLAAGIPNILVVHPALPAKSVRELIALAKAKPGELNYASGSAGASPHLAAELLIAMAGIKITRIPYKGGGPALNALMGGEVHLLFSVATTVAPHLKSGRVRALAVTSAQPSALYPELPTVAASGGLPGYEAGSTLGIFAPVKTPAALVMRLNREILDVLGRPETKDKLLTAGVEIIGSSPEQFAAAIKSDMARMGKVIKDAGIRVD